MLAAELMLHSLLYCTLRCKPMQIRVLARLRAVDASPKSTKLIALCWQLAGELVPADRPGDFNEVKFKYCCNTV
jgi:hypothetical protein